MKRAAFALALLLALGACRFSKRADPTDAAASAVPAAVTPPPTASTPAATSATPHAHAPGGSKTTTVITSVPTPDQAANKAKSEITRSNFRSELQAIEQEKDAPK